MKQCADSENMNVRNFAHVNIVSEVMLGHMSYFITSLLHLLVSTKTSLASFHLHNTILSTT